MPHLFGRDFTREELLRKVGRIEQIGGVQAITYDDGRERGVRAVQFRTGTGLAFTVASDRTLDIPAAEWQGRSLCWQTPNGVPHPSYYEPAGLGWLRTFPGGLLATCGLAWYGAPHEDPEGGTEAHSGLGLHGRVANLPATNVSYGGEWQGDEYVMWVEGRVQEYILFGEHLELRRRISTRLGDNRFYLRDVVTNVGFTPAEHMVMYHCNPGFPLLDEGARYLFPARRVLARSAWAQENIADWDKFAPPTAGMEEIVYYHELAGDAAGQTCVALVNDSTDAGQPLGLAIRYSLEMLPILTQWRMPGAGNYVTGIEPATNRGDGRPVERAAGRMKSLEPGQSRTYDLSFEVLTTAGALAQVTSEIQALSGGQAPELSTEAVA
ncbi:MAG TPA: aldose 1-epimerase family protein [Armatimonadota bacterium]|jgi:hypothetical protein